MYPAARSFELGSEDCQAGEDDDPGAGQEEQRDADDDDDRADGGDSQPAQQLHRLQQGTSPFGLDRGNFTLTRRIRGGRYPVG